jgi:hypothetical protein
MVRAWRENGGIFEKVKPEAARASGVREGVLARLKRSEMGLKAMKGGLARGHLVI